MTREILFRGFHKDENGKETIYIDGQAIKGEWVYGYYGYHNENKEHLICDEKDLENLEVIPETVSQYTGLDDKNGKKIFENDVILVEKKLKRGKAHLMYKVEYISRLAKFCIVPILISEKNHNNNFELDMCYYKKEDIEVIGTIFDKEVK